MSENKSNSMLSDALRKFANSILEIVNSSLDFYAKEFKKIPIGNSENSDELKKENPNSNKKSSSHFFVMEDGDLEEVSRYRKALKILTNSELVDAYNEIDELGESHDQGLYVTAMHQEFYLRFEKSPFHIDGSHLITRRGKIKYTKSTDSFVEEN